LRYLLEYYTGFVRVLENLESHGISNIPKSRPGNPGKSILVMESHGKLKFYITLKQSILLISIYQS
jgi:hypothetical protein